MSASIFKNRKTSFRPIGSEQYDSHRTCTENQSTNWSLDTLNPCSWQDCRRSDAWWDTCTLTVWSVRLTKESMGLRTVITCNLSSFRHSHHCIPHWTTVSVWDWLLALKKQYMKEEILRETNHLIFYMQVFIFVCVCVYVCCQSLSSVGLREKPLGFILLLERDRILRILSLGCPQRWLSQICGWWDGWVAACCFLTTWNAIYLSTWPTIQAGGKDGDKRAGRTVRDYRVMPVWKQK